MTLADARDDRLRVLHLHSGNLYGGVETMLRTIARHRDACPEMQTEFALCFDGRLGAELRRCGSLVHPIPSPRLRSPLRILRARRGLRSLLASRGYDVVVVHSCWSHLMFAPTLAASGAPYAIWLHGPPSKVRWLERLARRRQPDLAIANSRFTRGAVEAFWPGLPVSIVHPPVERPSDDCGDIESRRRIRRELGATDATVVILMACRMEAPKGHTVLLDALARLPRDERWACWIASEAQRPSEQRHERRLTSQVERLGLASHVRLLSGQDDVGRLMAAADLFCQPNLGPESFGIAFVEAMARRLVVITSAIGGALEVIDPSCGRLLPPGDATALGDEISRFIDDRALRERTAQRAYAHAQAFCDEKTQLQALHDVLKTASSRRPVAD